MVQWKGHSPTKFIEVAVHIVERNKMKIHFAIYPTQALLDHDAMGCLDDLILFKALYLQGTCSPPQKEAVSGLIHSQTSLS